MPKPPPPPSKRETLSEFLGSSKRDILPLRHTFLQQRDAQKNPIPGPLAAIVRRGVLSTLEQYMLLHARAAGRPSAGGEETHYDVYLESRVWARALGLYDDDSGLRTVQRNWKALSDLNLVSLDRSDRLTRVTLLCEDGSGTPYLHPANARDTPYLKLPYVYWLDDHSDRLRLPGTAMLLVALALPDWFSLPFKKGPTWYGVGSSTVERGLRELRHAGYLDTYQAWRKAPLTAQGWTQDWRYCLRPPFGPSGKVAKSAPPELSELLFTPKNASPSSQADSDTGKPKRRNPAAKKATSRAPKPTDQPPTRQPGEAMGKPKRRTPAVVKKTGKRAGGAGPKPGPTVRGGR